MKYNTKVYNGHVKGFYKSIDFHGKMDGVCVECGKHCPARKKHDDLCIECHLLVYIIKKLGHINKDKCWPTTLTQIRFNNTAMLTKRAFFAVFSCGKKSLPQKRVVNTCNNTFCVNPNHLEIAECSSYASHEYSISYAKSKLSEKGQCINCGRLTKKIRRYCGHNCRQAFYRKMKKARMEKRKNS